MYERELRDFLDKMKEHLEVPDTIFSNSPLRKAVHFDEIISIPPPSITSSSLLTSPSSTSLSLPLIAEKPGVRFKLLILLLSLLIALIIGFILSLVLIRQLIHLPPQTSLSHGFSSNLSEQNSMSNNHLFEHFDSIWIDELDFHTDICEDFYSSVCQKWLVNHPLSPLEFKRSWLTERSHDIREKFAKILANLSDIHAYNQQMELEKNQTEEIAGEPDIDDLGGFTSTKNE
jgi:hypothetical protein